MRARRNEVAAFAAASERLIGECHSYECRLRSKDRLGRDRTIVHGVSERPLATRGRRATERRPVSASAAGCLERARDSNAASRYVLSRPKLAVAGRQRLPPESTPSGHCWKWVGAWWRRSRGSWRVANEIGRYPARDWRSVPRGAIIRKGPHSFAPGSHPAATVTAVRYRYPTVDCLRSISTQVKIRVPRLTEGALPARRNVTRGFQ